MSNIVVNFSDFNDFADWLESEEAKKVCEEVAISILLDWENRAKVKSPADTGVLRQSWVHEGPTVNGNTIDGVLYNTAVADNGAPYPLYVNYGHRQEPGRFVPAIGKKLVKDFVPGKFFLEDATEETIAQIQAIWFQEVSEWWLSYGK